MIFMIGPLEPSVRNETAFRTTESDLFDRWISSGRLSANLQLIAYGNQACLTDHTNDLGRCRLTITTTADNQFVRPKMNRNAATGIHLTDRVVEHLGSVIDRVAGCRNGIMHVNLECSDKRWCVVTYVRPDNQLRHAVAGTEQFQFVGSGTKRLADILVANFDPANLSSNGQRANLRAAQVKRCPCDSAGVLFCQLIPVWTFHSVQSWCLDGLDRRTNDRRGTYSMSSFDCQRQRRDRDR